MQCHETRRRRAVLAFASKNNFPIISRKTGITHLAETHARQTIKIPGECRSVLLVILIVKDEDFLRSALADHLEDHGSVAHTATNAENRLEHLGVITLVNILKYVFSSNPIPSTPTYILEFLNIPRYMRLH